MYNVIFVNILFISKSNEKKLEFVGKKLESWKKPESLKKSKNAECANAGTRTCCVLFTVF